MTSNQIAAASVREDIRHNQATEEETNRHNVSTEALQEDANRIDEIYKTRSLDLKEYYDKQYLAYLEASEANKVELEKELNNIKQQQVDLEDWYNREMAGIQSRKNDIEAEWNATQAEIKWGDINLRDKELEYQKHQWDEQNAINQVANNIRAWELEEQTRYHDMQYQIELAKNETNVQYNKFFLQTQSARHQVDLMEYQLKASKLPEELNYMKSQEKLNASNVKLNNARILDVFNPFSTDRAKTASSLLNLFD